MQRDDYLLTVDDEAVHYLSERLIRKLQVRIDVERAMNGDEACRLFAKRGSPALMLLDLRMPCMDGHQVLSWMHREGVPPPPVVFVLSSSMRTEDRELVARFDFVSAYVEKPLRKESFVSLLSDEPNLLSVFPGVPPVP